MRKIPSRNHRETTTKGAHASSARARALGTSVASWALLASALGGCAGDPSFNKLLSSDPVTTQVTQSNAAMGARISFHFSDYYSLTNPNSNSCAGDARFLYDPLALILPTAQSVESGGFGSSGVPGLSVAAGVTGPTGPLMFPKSASGDDETIRPSFIKNISVDLTDANANISQNASFSCSVGNGVTAPPVSRCATFDYGGIGGVPTTLGGTLMLFGGVQGYNYAGHAPSSSGLVYQGHTVSCGPVLPEPYLSSPTGYTSCGAGFYALGINTLPSSVLTTNPNLAPGLIGVTGVTGPISTWANLSGGASYSGPSNRAGASIAYSNGLQRLLLFGGAAPLDGTGSMGPGMTTYDTWVYDLKSQAWTSHSATTYVASQLLTLYDTALDITAPNGSPSSSSSAPVSRELAKAVGGRAVFGYVPVPGMAPRLDAMSSAGAMTSSLIDKTDRLLVIGGLGSAGAMGDVHRFNPTFGPEIRDALGGGTRINYGSSGANGVDFTPAGNPYQWLDSYHTQLLSNSYGQNFATGSHRYSNGSSNFRPDLPPLGTGATGGSYVLNSAFAPLVNVTPTALSGGVQGTGYVLGAGGFDASATVNAQPSGTITAFPDTANGIPCTQDGTTGGTVSLQCGGGLSLLTRFHNVMSSGAGPSNEALSSFWGAVSNYIDYYSTPNTPALWKAIAENTDASTNQTVPWVGGATMLPGFDLTNNEVVYFGGLACRNYVDDSTAACGSYQNPGRYFAFGADPATSLTAGTLPSASVPTFTSAATDIPVYAGMASARGLDPAGNVIIVAWGGARAGATTSTTNKVYYLYRSGATPYWSSVTSVSSGGGVPANLINSAMVFSHVTRKFYVFGGYDPSGTTRGDTWELSVSSPSSAACNGSNCTFTWRKLNPDTLGNNAGLTCYPSSCPPVRRSHRMAEVNYNNVNPGGTGSLSAVAGTTADGEQTCPADRPCSYGIFMEGGTSDGYNYLNDRWMFDPTANGGDGHWQLVTELPPRTLAAAASLDYAIPGTTNTAHRAILFGGETSLQSPLMAAKGNGGVTQYFVAPTLGDTWMYDYDQNAWHRVQLLGKGYAAAGSIPAAPETERRQAYRAYDPAAYTDNFNDTSSGTAYDLGKHVNELSPPPLAGAIMVTRTQAPVDGVTTDSLRALKLPEIYLFGGRLKDGTFNTLDHVYKFCAGSTGEAFKTDSTSSLLSFPNDDDFTCDAYDPVLNPGSPSPQATYVGRWLRKEPGTASAPDIDPTATGSFMGAGAYDPTRDRIVLIGGLSAAAAGTKAVTQRASLQIDSTTTGTETYASVYEYTPPQRQLSTTPREGRWAKVASCDGTGPTPRYGHALVYDASNQALVMTGGYDLAGEPLTQTVTAANGATYEIPEVWTAHYYGANISDGSLNAHNPGVTISNAPCYYWKQLTTFGNAFDVPSQAPPMTGLAHSAAVYIPGGGYNTGYYTMLDNACTGAGPIATSDATINKLLAGGVYIDIDRSALGANENLLLNLTYLPLGTSNVRPDGQALSAEESAVFRIHLVKTGQTPDVLRSILQPRFLAYADTDTQFPQVAQSISVLAPPTGQIAQEQVVIPLSIDPAIDRIRIERLSGSGLLLDASIFRMGTK